MVDLTDEMAELRTSLPPVEGGRATLFVSAKSGEGGSTVAREFARLSAVTVATSKRRVWLIDADLEAQLEGRGQIEAVAAEPARFGDLGAPGPASPDGSGFFSVHPPLRGADGAPLPAGKLMIARPALGGRLWVTGLNPELVASGGTADIEASPAYWTALRRHAVDIVVDVPSGDRAGTALRLAPVVDLIVLVVAADLGAQHSAMELRDALEAAGGRVAGLVFNRADKAFTARLARSRAS
jgi:hypothetical protein